MGPFHRDFSDAVAELRSSVNVLHVKTKPVGFLPLGNIAASFATICLKTTLAITYPKQAHQVGDGIERFAQKIFTLFKFVKFKIKIPK